MQSIRPPKCATWLLRHFRCGPNNDAVIGDLEERYRQGRSRAWYWRQVLRAIVTSLAQEMRAHKMLALRGVTTSGILLLVGMLSFHALGDALLRLSNSESTLGKIVRDVLIFHQDIALIQRIALWCLGWAGIGWALKRVCRPHHKAMELTFSTTVFAALVFIISIQRHATSSITHPLLGGFSGNIIGLICLLIGTGLLRSPRPTQPSPR